MDNRRLNFEELTSLFADQNFEKNDEDLFVQVDANFTIDEQQDKYKEGLIPFRCKAYHDMDNLNNSRIEPDAFIDNTKSIEGRPVLANIVEGKNGDLDFGGHDFHMEEDADGNLVRVYDEKPIGVVTNYGFADDPEAGVTRAVVFGYLFENYAREAVQILQERKTCSCSVELAISACHYDRDSRRLVLDDYCVQGVTILGSDYKPGMAGSEISLESFSKENNSVIFNTYKHLTEEEMSRVQGDWMREFLLSNQLGEKGGEGMDADKNLEEVVEEAAPVESKMTISIVDGEDFAREFSVSLTEKLSKVYRAFDNWNCENNRDYQYICEVFDDCVVYRDSENSNWYKAMYLETPEKTEFVGEPVRVTVLYKTEEELAADSAANEALREENASLKAKVEAMEAKLGTYEAEELSRQKDEVLKDPVFESCLETEEFKEVIAKKDEMTLDEFSLQTELAFAKIQRRRMEKPAMRDSAETAEVKLFDTPKEETRKSRYGNIFNK